MDDLEVVVPGWESKVAELDVGREICVVLDQLPVVVLRLAAVPLAVSVVAQTRPRVGRGLDLPLLVDEVRESPPEDGLEVILSGWESTEGMSDVSRGICMEPDLLPVVMSTDDVEPLAVPVVALTKSQVEGPEVVARTVNVDVISRAVVYPDLLSGRVRKSVDPDVRGDDPMSLKTIPVGDGDACHSEWREMVLDDVVMVKFVLVPEVCPVGYMMSVAELTLLPALSEVYSPGFFGRGVVAAANPLAVVESDTVRVSVLPMESDTARVSALPVVGVEVPAVYIGKVALDSVGLRVGPSCLRLDPEETLPALLDERGVTSDVDLGVT